MYYEKAVHYHGTLKDFTPKAPITDRASWEKLDKTYCTLCITEAEKYLDFSYPYLSATDYLKFTRTGNRTDFEDVYFKKRNVLNILVLAECIENKGRFLDDIVNGIFSICDETAWQLPPHNSYIRDTPQLPLPDETVPVLDLFACETGALLAMIHYLLKNSLDAVSPFICKRILSQLDKRILTPYLTMHFWWMGHDDEPMCNWTIWCTQNILLTTFLTPQTDKLRRSVFEKASKSTDYFLKEYGDDGCCDEGAQYYHHSGLCLFLTTEILNAVTSGAFSDMYEEKKICNIADYILKVHVGGKYYVNFADCSPVAGRAGVREFLFGKMTHNPDMMKYAATDFKIATDSYCNAEMLLLNEINLTYRLLTAFHLDEVKTYDISGTISHQDIYFESVGLFLMHDSKFCLAVKAGDNADSHNHNDTGSFTIYKNGLPFLIDIGVESYTQKTFSPDRYSIWTMQSAYHNLPTIHGFMQKAGASYKATDVNVSMKQERDEISFDIASAYPKEAAIEHYRRCVVFDKEAGIMVTDRYSCTLPFDVDSVSAFESQHYVNHDNNTLPDLDKLQGKIVLSLMSYEKPALDGLLIHIGTLGTISLSTICPTKIETIPITDPRLQTCWEHDVYRILITLPENEFSLKIE